MPIGNRNWKSAGALTVLVLMLFTTAAVPEMTVNAGNSYAQRPDLPQRPQTNEKNGNNI